MNNQATVSGMITSVEMKSDQFYLINVCISRMSGNCDVVPVIVSKRFVFLSEDNIGQNIRVLGQFRSYDKSENGKNKLILYLYAEKLIFVEDFDQTNAIVIEGCICKSPTYRKTPFGRWISDILVAVDRLDDRSDYIPVIAWGKDAKQTASMNVGDQIRIQGRIQSREYIKNNQTCTVYEVSAQSIERL